MIHVTCAIIVDREKNVLVTQRSAAMSMPLKMEFPGGKIEPGENPETCLIREIKEELDLEINVISEMPAHIHSYPEIDINLIPFICEVKSGTIRLKEHAAYYWLSPNQLVDLDWAAADIPILKNYLLTI